MKHQENYDLEDKVSAEFQIEASKIGVFTQRNNSGAFTNESGRHIRFGLGNISKKQNDNIKSSDYICIVPVLITPAMIGKIVGVYAAFEIKKPSFDEKKPMYMDKRAVAQKNYIEFVRSRFAIAGFVNSVESFKKIIADFKEKLVK